MTRDLIDFTRINNDVNGKPRYVVRFLSLNTRAELDAVPWLPVGEKYRLALKRAHRIGGRKFHTKQFGGGIVFQCYGADDIGPAIARVLAEDEVTA